MNQRRRMPRCSHGPDFWDAERDQCVKCPKFTLVKPEFQKLADAAMRFAPSQESIRGSEDREAVHLREQRLRDSGVIGSITDEDAAWIAQDTLPLNPHALQAVKRWHASRLSSTARPMTILVLVGLTGRGKTLGGGWLLARLGGVYTTAEDLRRATVSNQWREAALLDRYMTTRCTVVDDAGGELDANSASAAMFNFVNRRAGDARSWTLIPANLTGDEFRQRYGERTVRRIEHNGAIIEVKGEDLRRKP